MYVRVYNACFVKWLDVVDFFDVVGDDVVDFVVVGVPGCYDYMCLCLIDKDAKLSVVEVVVVGC